jgi:hypothetical protein
MKHPGVVFAMIASFYMGGLAFGAGPKGEGAVPEGERFPYYLNEPVSYQAVTLRDGFWAPRQERIGEATHPWATARFDESGGLAAYREDPASYEARIRPGDLEVIKYVEALGASLGVEGDPAVEGLAEHGDVARVLCTRPFPGVGAGHAGIHG